MTKVKSKNRNKKGPRKTLFNRIICISPFVLLIIAVFSVSIIFIRKSKWEQKTLYQQQLQQEILQGMKEEYESQTGAMDRKMEQSLSLILNGNVHLISIHESHHHENRVHSFLDGKDNTPKKPYSVAAKFCHLDWNLQKNNPPAVPMNKDLIQQSKRCRGSVVHMDLYDAVTKAKQYDLYLKKKNNDTNNHHERVHTMEPRGFVFHESRCGSTLAANALAAFEPEKNRVYSESSPPITAAKMYDPGNEEASLQILRDVVYLMGRTNDVKEENLFFKIQSIGVKSIHVFRKAFPTTPWVFVYRDPVQVMRSHLKIQSTNRAVCLRARSHPGGDLIQLVDRIGNTGGGNNGVHLKSLNNEDFCAAHLATLCEAAIQQVKDSDGLGKVVNYNKLMTSLAENLIPRHFLNIDSLSQESKKNIEKISEHYSKGRKGQSRTWEEDSTQKEDTAWVELKDASTTYLQPSYDELEKLQGPLL